MLLGLTLLYVGAVLFLNGLWLIGRIGDREIAVINIFVGGITLLVALYAAFVENNPASIRGNMGNSVVYVFSLAWSAKAHCPPYRAGHRCNRHSNRLDPRSLDT